MGQSKEMFTELQNEAATRSNPEFQNYMQSIINAPSPKDLQEIAISAARELMTECNLSIYQQSMMIGFMQAYGDAARADVLSSKHTPETMLDHELMLYKENPFIS